MDIFSAYTSQNKEEMLRSLSFELFKKGYVKDSFVDGVLHRERTNPTGLQVEDLINIAIPHTDIDNVNRPTIVVIKKSDHTDFIFNRLDEPTEEIPVQVVFLLVVKEPNGYVDFLADLTGLFQESAFIDLLLSSSPEQICQTLVEKLSQYQLSYRGDLTEGQL